MLSFSEFSNQIDAFGNQLVTSKVRTILHTIKYCYFLLFGLFEAEVKFRESLQDYEPLILSKDREWFMKLLTFKSIEEMVKKRVEKKATLFSQEISLDNNDDNNEKQKFDSSGASKLYGKWVIPLTKEVQVDYPLRRLD